MGGRRYATRLLYVNLRPRYQTSSLLPLFTSFTFLFAFALRKDIALLDLIHTLHTTYVVQWTPLTVGIIDVLEAIVKGAKNSFPTAFVLLKVTTLAMESKHICAPS